MLDVGEHIQPPVLGSPVVVGKNHCVAAALGAPGEAAGAASAAAVGGDSWARGGALGWG